MVGRIEYELAGADLGEVRFALSPMNELTLSLRTWREPGRYPLQLPWLHLTQAARAELDGEMLLALTNDSLWTPDFLTPRPWTPLTRFDDELAALAQTPLDVVRDDIAEVHPDPATRPAVLTGRRDRVLRRITTALAAYWTACFEPWWPRMRAVLEADIVFRGRTIAREGLAAMFAGLSPRIRLVDDVLHVHLSSKVGFRRSTAGEGLTLAPSLFTRNATAPISAEEPPLILYGARGAGTLWESERPAAPRALAGLVGEVRARLLAVLDSPASSTELAIRLGVTTSAVNQHLRAMRDAGLLSSARHGRSVLYLRSGLGDELVSAAAPR
ncbi:helix-turn-helix domain-containing protein [Nocardioides sp. LMS-CY]|uniref:DNA-binding transcriptional ArsR family regulator n=1 Tax=Nocardioides soli TaxID=1036020 RepID=A0A7W4Z0E8_9ACTN|nr:MULTISPECIES: helix-turn-helix domain-containing protein [Nocardioides]MBB3041808.1 DNA-binding transcriptional ArsR family regulator [Nocardioides soli]QWF21321.1 helix-turn-helix domain-containing protein [Nocardioides sp. LMS-CY]